MELDNLIFDRTQADVGRAAYLSGLWQNGTFTGTTAELAEWATDLKGAYNATDLNRVIAAMDYLNEYFLGLGYDVGYTKIAVPHQPEPSILPDGYTQLDYIQSNGAQYIDTGFKPNQDTRVIVDIEVLTSQTTEGHICSVAGSLYYTLFFDPEQSNWYGTRYGTGPIKTLPASVNTRNRITIDKNKNVTTIDDVSVEDSISTFQTSYNLPIFVRNTSGNINSYIKAKLYSFRLYDNGTLVRDYIPCVSPENIIGLYDLVNDQFYSNAGSGTFTAGPNTPPPEPTKDPYTWYEDDIPTQNEMSIYIENVQRLRDKIPYPPGTPDAPSDMELLTYQEANNIEKILYTLESVLIAMENGFLLRQANTLFMIAGGVFNNA